MDIDYHTVGTVLVVDVPEGTGRLAYIDIEEFIQGILEATKPPVTTIAFDLSRQEFLNSAGLGELVKVKDRLLDRSIELALINCAPRVASLITVAGVDRFFTVVRSEDELLQR
ncbi:MAG TPA: STAS domain-containing protein [Spirochaetota bacterium]|nr:STAS domain-containing protein [Spirochaetota bacterium]